MLGGPEEFLKSINDQRGLSRLQPKGSASRLRDDTLGIVRRSRSREGLPTAYDKLRLDAGHEDAGHGAVRTMTLSSVRSLEIEVDHSRL
jgi:hypothetical protein